MVDTANALAGHTGTARLRRSPAPRFTPLHGGAPQVTVDDGRHRQRVAPRVTVHVVPRRAAGAR
jgi:hypothetical protein